MQSAFQYYKRSAADMKSICDSFFYIMQLNCVISSAVGSHLVTACKEIAYVVWGTPEPSSQITCSGYVGNFYSLATANRTAIDMVEQVSL